MKSLLQKLLLASILLILGCNALYSRLDELQRMSLNMETFQKWDAFIKEHAPSDSALALVNTFANRHYVFSRFATAREVYLMYEQYFPEHSDYFAKQLEDCEAKMLSITPSRDLWSIYDKYIKEKAPYEDAFVAVQRLSDGYIDNKQWDSAASVYYYYKPYFPEMATRFESIISIIEAEEQPVVIRNLGSAINTGRSEWDPTPTPDGKYLFFSARDRSGGYGQSDVFVSEMKDGTWQKPYNAGRQINGLNDETVDNVTADGTGLLLSGTFEGTYGKFDIYFIERTDSGWGHLTHLPMPINSEWTDEGANISGNGKAFMFSSDRPGGIGRFIPYGDYIYHGNIMGNMDIYVCLRTDSGWSEPINLGPTINTPYSERAPYLHPDGRTLYFSSDAHPGLGRLDVFKSVRLKEDSWTEWSTPINLGKEINTARDDWGYIISTNGDSAFFAGLDRPGGFGGWDIYSMSLPERAKPGKVLTVGGKVTDSKGRPLSVTIKWEDLSTGENIGVLKSNPKTGDYFIVLQYGKNYGYFAEKENYYPTSNNIDLTDSSRFELTENSVNNANIRHDIIMKSSVEIRRQKLRIGLNNIFFDYDKAELKQESFSELNRLIDFLGDNQGAKIEIEGHTDSVGSAAYNKLLSLKRAESVRDYILEKTAENKSFNVDIQCKGHGSSKPVADNDTESGRAANRRVEIWFVE